MDIEALVVSECSHTFKRTRTRRENRRMIVENQRKSSNEVGGEGIMDMMIKLLSWNVRSLCQSVKIQEVPWIF